MTCAELTPCPSLARLTLITFTPSNPHTDNQVQRYLPSHSLPSRSVPSRSFPLLPYCSYTPPSPLPTPQCRELSQQDRPPVSHRKHCPEEPKLAPLGTEDPTRGSSMKGLLPLTKCVLLALTLLVPATHGYAHPSRRQQQQYQQQQDPGYQPHYGRGGYSRMDGRLPGHGRLPNSHKRHLSTPAWLRQLLGPLSDRLDPLDDSLEGSLSSNDLGQNRALPFEDLAPYTTRHIETYQEHGRDRSRHYLAPVYQNHHEEVCATKKNWDVLKETVDMDGNPVVIIMSGETNQTFYSYKCIEPCQACKKVIGNSRCKQRYTYVKMLHYLKESPAGPSDSRWGFVEVPSHCACELMSHPIYDTECTLK